MLRPTSDLPVSSPETPNMLRGSIKYSGTNKLPQYSPLCLKEHWESMDLVLLRMDKISFFFFFYF